MSPRPSGIDFRNPWPNDCEICYNAQEELEAAWSVSMMLRGEAALDAADRDISLFERILEEHPNHDLTVADSMMARIGFVATGDID